MGLAFLIVLGGILGWLTAIVLDAETRHGMLLNIGAGIAGALVTGLVLSPILGGGSLLGGHNSIAALMLSLLGAIAAIASANIYRHVQLH